MCVQKLGSAIHYREQDVLWLNSRVFEGSCLWVKGGKTFTFIVAYNVCKDFTYREIMARKNQRGLISGAGSSF